MEEKIIEEKPNKVNEDLIKTDEGLNNNEEELNNSEIRKESEVLQRNPAADQESHPAPSAELPGGRAPFYMSSVSATPGAVSPQ